MNKKIPMVSVKLVKEATLPYNIYKPIQTVREAYQVFKEIIEDSDRELFCVLAVDNKNCPCYVEIVSKGSVSSAVVNPREVFKSAILSNASGIFMAHNHPSGNCIPSDADLNITEILAKSGGILGIKVIDHLILGQDKYISLQERHYFEFSEHFVKERSKFIDVRNR